MTTLMMLFAITVLGYLLGSVKVCGLQLGTSGVLLVGLVFGHFGMVLPNIVRDIGLVFFVTAVGFIAGPIFFQNFKNKAMNYIILGILIIGVGAVISVLSIKYWGISVPASVGLLAGALTSTPGLAAALEASRNDLVSITYGIAYPFGVVGVVLFVQLMPRIMRVDIRAEIARLEVAASEAKKKEGEKDEQRKYRTVESFGFFALGAACVLGLLIGRISVPLPGGANFNLGTTGGPLLVGLVMGHFNHVGSLSIAVPAATAKPLRELGLIFFLMGAGTQAGKGFVEVLVQNGPMLFFAGAAMTLVPMIVACFVAIYLMKLELSNTLGSITGGMTSTPALGALIEVAGSDYVAAAYAATYPIALICVVLSCQFIALLL
ncbi:MAG: permease [Synergistaceae bacterium]|jgi:putative transport protein|nr:permease [Synergistaceae bacterium]